MSIIPQQRDAFTTALWTAFAVLGNGDLGWHDTAPLARDWFTADAVADLDRATDLLCAADTALMDATFSGNTAAEDQARTHVQKLTDLCDVLAAVIDASAAA